MLVFFEKESLTGKPAEAEISETNWRGMVVRQRGASAHNPQQIKLHSTASIAPFHLIPLNFIPQLLWLVQLDCLLLMDEVKRYYNSKLTRKVYRQ